MLSVKSWTAGRLQWATYDFTEVGDSIPRHSHTEVDNHITAVQLGAVFVHGDGWALVVAAGSTVDWPVGTPHEIVAMEPGTRIMNIIK